MNDPKLENQAQQQELDASKRAYEQPAIVYRAPLEATAGNCTTKSDISCSAPLQS